MRTLVAESADKNRLKQQLTLKYASGGASPFTKARLLAAFGVDASMNATQERKTLGSTHVDTKAEYCNNPLEVVIQRVEAIIQSNKLLCADTMFSPGCNDNAFSACTDEQLSTFQSENESFTYPAVSTAEHFLGVLTESTTKGGNRNKITIAKCIRIVFWEWIPEEVLKGKLNEMWTQQFNG